MLKDPKPKPKPPTIATDKATQFSFHVLHKYSTPANNPWFHHFVIGTLGFTYNINNNRWALFYHQIVVSNFNLYQF